MTTRSMTERLARYYDPDPFNERKRSARNREAAHRARKHQMKMAKAAIRFFKKPENFELIKAAIAEGEDK